MQQFMYVRVLIIKIYFNAKNIVVVTSKNTTDIPFILQ